MSLKRDKTVSQIIEKLRQQYPTLDRDLVRRLIRLENPKLNLRTVDRHLKRSFEENPNITQKEYVDKLLKWLAESNTRAADVLFERKS
jgi:hypothetical protein